MLARRSGKRVAKRRVGRGPTRSARRESRAVSPASRRLHNLPTQLTSFIGREREIVEVKRLLGTTRLLTLTGSGGCGKMRLAFRIAGDFVNQNSNGVWLTPMATVSPRPSATLRAGAQVPSRRFLEHKV